MENFDNADPLSEDPDFHPKKEAGERYAIVGIGASAGGLDAFRQLLENLPTTTGMAFVLVQHLDPTHESALPSILARTTTMPVMEARENQTVAPNCVYVIPPNCCLLISGGVLKLSQRERSNGMARTIDAFFESLANDQRQHAIGVVLSGTASDGTLGLEAIKAEGGFTFAQDETAVHGSMPKSAIASGCVDFVLSPIQIAAELERISKHPIISGARKTPTIGAKNELAEDGSGEGFKRILFYLRRQSGVDFSLYKPTTIRRRVNRRMVLNKINTLEEYAERLLQDEKELSALCSDALINVTAFFRDPQSFEILQESIFPKIILNRGDQPVRIWIAACSTGQEAYSVAMAFCEVAERLNSAVKFQIFATDVSESVLAKARLALYPKTLVQDLSPERLQRFFVEEGGGYRVKKTLREMFVFARQNLAADPPFSRLDLISCRNLMIYLDASLQRKVVPIFHYALKPGGYLFLGSSETVGSFTDLFQPLDKKHKIYLKLPGNTSSLRMTFETNSTPDKAPMKVVTAALARVDPALTPQREADRVTLKRRAPPALLIDDQFQVLQFRGDTSVYLKTQEGAATHHALEILRDGLLQALKEAVAEARQERQIVRAENLLVRTDGATLTVHLEVTPLKNLRFLCYLVEFEDASQVPATEDSRNFLALRLRSLLAKENQSLEPNAAVALIAHLRDELEEVRDFARAHQEQQEAATEELQTSNEEIQSSNEELQSINEELETAKEELESANEELNTVNEEMVSRNTELNRLNSDLRNLQHSIDTTIVLLDRGLTIRSFTVSAAKDFNLLPADVGRPFGHIQHNLNCPDLEQILLRVVETGAVTEREVQDKNERWYSLRIRPYLTLENRIDGAVLMLVDVDALKTSEQAIKASRDYVENIVHSTRYPLLVLNEDLRVESANAAFYRTFHTTAAETLGRQISSLGERQWDIPRLRALLTDVLRRDCAFDDLEVSHDFTNFGPRTMLLNGRRLHLNGATTPDQILVAIDDITESKQLETVRISETRYRRLFEAAKDGIILVDPGAGKISDANPFVCDLLGLDGKELSGLDLTQLGLFPDPESGQSVLRELREKGYYRNADLQISTRQGEFRNVEVVSNLYVEGDNRVIQINVRDITERRKAENAALAASERFRFLAEALPEKIFTAKPNGEFDYVNEQWASFSRLGLDEIRDWGWVQLIHLDDVKENLRRWNRSIVTGEDFQVEHRFRRFDGVYRWHLSRASAMRNAQGKILLWIGSNTDIDDQKLASEKLERTVAERTARLSEIIGELEAFSYSVSHDLRAPLRSIQSFAGLLIEDCGDKVGEAGRSHLSRITSAAHRMDRLIQDILSFSLVARAQLPLQVVDLDHLVRGVVDSYPNLHPHSAQISIVGTLPKVMGNEAALTQCISNLLGNGVKFVAAGATPKITIRAENKKTMIRIWVEDNGIGMNEDVLGKIFGIFQRVSKNYEGTGIGLAIVKKAAERMGGSVGVESTVGVGSKFWVELPGAGPETA